MPRRHGADIRDRCPIERVSSHQPPASPINFLQVPALCLPSHTVSTPIPGCTQLVLRFDTGPIRGLPWAPTTELSLLTGFPVFVPTAASVDRNPVETLIKRGGGAGPVKPRQPALIRSRPAACQVPIPAVWMHRQMRCSGQLCAALFRVSAGRGFLYPDQPEGR